MVRSAMVQAKSRGLAPRPPNVIFDAYYHF